MKNLVFISLLLISAFSFGQNFRTKTSTGSIEHERKSYSSALYTSLDTSINNSVNKRDTGFLNWLLNKNMISKVEDNYRIIVNPAFNFMWWQNKENDGYINTRGAEISGNFSNKIFFHTAFYENQGRFPEYLDNYADKYSVLPGYARMKPYRNSSWDYSSALGSIEFAASEKLNFRFGHDKLFLGSGHRSLILSDAAFQQLFLQSSFKYKNFRFTNLSMQWINPNFNNPMQWDIEQSSEGNYQRKFNSINMIEYNFKNFRLSLFESIVFNVDEQMSKFNYNMLNPIIFARSAIIGRASNDNILLGADFIYHNDKLELYSQFVIDDLSNANIKFSNPINRLAWQAGIKYYNLFKIKNLNIQAEHNYVKAKTYQTRSPEESYTHYNQSVAHPAGNNFVEFIGKIQYRYNSFPVNLQLNYMISGDQDYYGNLSPAVFDNKGVFISGEKNDYLFFDFETAYIINPNWNWTAYLGITYRASENDNLWLRIGTKSTIRRLIRDI